MNRFGPLLKRFRKLEPDPEKTEPWPVDVEGSLSKVLYDQFEEEGVELPAGMPEPTPLMYPLMNGAERCWAEEVVDGEA